MLPPEHQRRANRCSGGEAADVDKRISKAEVLDAAVQRIRQLELRNRRLMKERESLRNLNKGDLAAWQAL